MTRLAALLVLLPSLAFGQVVDGDTIRVGGVTWRLWGIDAPESRQECDGWPAGRLATSRLQELVSGRSVTCEAKATDRYGRTVGVCFAGGVDLGAAMVREGWALAFVRYSRDYARQEELARAERVGVHGRACEAPWDWRARQRP